MQYKYIEMLRLFSTVQGSAAARQRRDLYDQDGSLAQRDRPRPQLVSNRARQLVSDHRRPVKVVGVERSSRRRQEIGRSNTDVPAANFRRYLTPFPARISLSKITDIIVRAIIIVWREDYQNCSVLHCLHKIVW